MFEKGMIALILLLICRIWTCLTEAFDKSAETSNAIVYGSLACGLAALNLWAGLKEGRIRAGQSQT
jgi:hypothetical protein